MRAVSKRRAAQLRTYRKLRDEYLTGHPRCEFPECGQVASDLHHKAGRVGALLTDVTRWAALCRPCHRWVTENPAAAYELGISEHRIGAA